MNNSISLSKYGSHTDQILCTALDVGEGLLKSGATVRRAEDTIERICRAHGAIHVEVFCIPSLILATIRMADGDYASQNRRIYSNSNNFHRIDRYNSVSRKLCNGEMTPEEAQVELKSIKKASIYPGWLMFPANALVCGMCSVFFGGTPRDGIFAATIGLVVAFIRSRFPLGVNPFSTTLICSMLAGLLSIPPFYFGLAENYDKIMIGTIMMFIPGMAFGTSLRDLLGGDTVAGLLQFIQAILQAAVVAFGYSIAMYLLRALIA